MKSDNIFSFSAGDSIRQTRYVGLSDDDVIRNRQKYGDNILTPPQEVSIKERVKASIRFWLLRTIFVVFLLSIALTSILTSINVLDLSNAIMGLLFQVVLLLLVFLVLLLGGEISEKDGKLVLDSLVVILLSALMLSAFISVYEIVCGIVDVAEALLEPLGISLAVILATGMTRWMKVRNGKAFKSLESVDDGTLVAVVRNSNISQVPRSDIVVGDVVLLTMGEEVPADCELLEASSLNLDESTLTGEPSCFKTTNEDDFDKDATYPSNHIMKGTTILEGYCTARVFAVGDSTAWGKVFEASQVKDDDPTPLGQKLDGLADLITKVSYFIAGLIIVGRVIMYLVHIDDDFDLVNFVKYTLDTVMIAVTLIVVAVPEGLPMAVTLSLAFSMKRLMEQNTLPRTMHACETMGATSVICTDKTGTLTQNQMQIYECAFTELPSQKLDGGKFSRLLIEAVSTNTTANLDYSDKKRIKTIGSPTEGALLLWLYNLGVNYLDIRESVEVKDRIPFSTENKYMATVVMSQVLNCRVLYVTGAPDILLDLCGVSGEEQSTYESILLGYQNQAKRTLGLAIAELKDGDDVILDGKLVDTRLLRMMGVVAISDPIRPEVPTAIKDCIDAGIKVKIITGDTLGTAKEIGRQVGLWNDRDTDRNILYGPDIQNMTDDQMKDRLPDVKVISRARPNDKERVVRMLKEMGEVVAVTGDGTNDAPALNVANVGLSMGDGTAVAKEASDMTILDNSFSTIANAVMWGRSLYKNIKRFILFQMTVNVTACLIVLIGAFLGTESPLSVTQMLWVNLIMDTFAALALASLPPTRTVMSEKPRSVNEHILHGMGTGILGVGLVFTAILFGLLIFFQHTDVSSLWNVVCGKVEWGAYNGLSDYELGLFFTIFVMLQFWNMFNAKAFMTTDSAFKGISWKNTRWFIIISLVIFIGQVIMIECPGVQEMFNVAEGGIALSDWCVILGGTFLVLLIGEVIRKVKRFDNN